MCHTHAHSFLSPHLFLSPKVLLSVTRIRDELEGDIPLIGFSAAPWTLFYYMVGGSSKKGHAEGMRWLREHHNASSRLMNTLETVVTEYLSLQVEAGAQMLQVFEAMGEFISGPMFSEWALPPLRNIAAELKLRHPDIPLMVFPRGAAYSLTELAASYDVLTLDGDMPRGAARRRLPDKTLQGDFDPTLLLEGGTEQAVRDAANTMIQELGSLRLIANLKAGLSGKEQPALVAALIDAVHEWKPADACTDQTSGARRRLQVRGSVDADAQLADEADPEGRWLGEWQARIRCWWIGTPHRASLQACFSALGIHLAERFEALTRGAAAATPQPPLAAADPGCEWLREVELGLPEFPSLPDEGLSPSRWPALLPGRGGGLLPRLLPDRLWVQAVEMDSGRRGDLLGADLLVYQPEERSLEASRLRMAPVALGGAAAGMAIALVGGLLWRKANRRARSQSIGNRVQLRRADSK